MTHGDFPKLFACLPAAKQYPGRQVGSSARGTGGDETKICDHQKRGIDDGDSNYWLVVWNICFFPYIGNNTIIPTDEVIFFRGVQTTNQIITVSNLKSSTSRT